MNTSKLTFTKPQIRWLWGGFGFHNAEISMSRMMTDEFRDERAIKTFLEISPSYSRVFAGFSKWTHEEMDRFADYYYATFKKADTVLYAVPCRMPMIDRDFDCDAYAEKVAVNLEYLIKERGCSRICFYCVTNETSVGPCYGWFVYYKHLDIYKSLNEALFRAFRRHDLEIGLMTPDSSGEVMLPNLEWAVKELPEITEAFCWHYYDSNAIAGDPANYAKWIALFSKAVGLAGGARRRLSLGEFGLAGAKAPGADLSCAGVMRDGRGYVQRSPSEAPVAALSLAEMGIAAMNAGCLNAVLWTMADYPDPFFGYPGGEKARDLAENEAKDRAAFALDQNYNKWGLFRWCDDDQDYRAYPSLYTMGYLAKFFRRGARVLPWTTDDELLRGAGVTNSDGSVTYAVINWGEAKTIRIASPVTAKKTFRVYRYDSANVPDNEFNDLQPCEGTVTPLADGTVEIAMTAKSMVFLTTDYVERTPPEVMNVRLSKGVLSWDAIDDADHCYYRVFFKGKQIASTVATQFSRGIARSAKVKDFTVESVDRWGNSHGK